MNTNCLEGFKCPKCGQEDEILLWVANWVSLKDDGSDPFADSLKNLGDLEWDGSTSGMCPVCKFKGNMRKFFWRKGKKQ
jgi:hypothetical protein